MGCTRGLLLVLVERPFGARLRTQPANWCTAALHTACMRTSRLKRYGIQAESVAVECKHKRYHEQRSCHQIPEHRLMCLLKSHMGLGRCFVLLLQAFASTKDIMSRDPVSRYPRTD